MPPEDGSVFWGFLINCYYVTIKKTEKTFHVEVNSLLVQSQEEEQRVFTEFASNVGNSGRVCPPLRARPAGCPSRELIQCCTGKAGCRGKKLPSPPN